MRPYAVINEAAGRSGVVLPDGVFRRASSMIEPSGVTIYSGLSYVFTYSPSFPYTLLSIIFAYVTRDWSPVCLPFSFMAIHLSQWFVINCSKRLSRPYQHDQVTVAL